MALKGKAKADYQREYMREYMRRRREAAGPKRRTPDGPTRTRLPTREAPVLASSSVAGAVLSVHVPRDLARFAFRVLLAHAANPDGLTDFELASLVRGQQNSAGKRRGELMAQGYILRTEGRRPAPSGSTAIVWKITETGLALAELMIERNDPGMPPLPSRAAP